MGSGTQETAVRTAVRLAGASLAALVAFGLPPGAALAAPTNAEVAAAAAAADAVTARIGELSARITAAEDSVEAAHAASTIALDQ